LFLKELFRIQVSNNTEIPLERLICHFVDSVYLQSESTLKYYIGTQELIFYQQAIYAQQIDLKDESLEVLFTCLSIDNIILLWQAVLLERKVFIISKSKSVIINICMALITLIFPFKWIHVFIPILPEKLRPFIDSLVPALIGICFQIDNNELPLDAVAINADNNQIEKYLDKMPKLPQKLHLNLLKKLEKFKYKFNNPADLVKVQFVDEVFNYQDGCDEDEKFNTLDIRDSFYEFFVLMFKNFEKYFGKMKKNKDGFIEPLVMNKEAFLKDHNSLEV